MQVKKVILLVTLMMTFSHINMQAQEVSLEADFVSEYIWRGSKLSNAAIQPSISLEWKGLTVSAWGSTEFRHSRNEIDINLEYEYKNLTFCFYNYFNQSEDESFSYFNYNSHSTGHTFEAGLMYQISEKFPLTAGW